MGDAAPAGMLLQLAVNAYKLDAVGLTAEDGLQTKAEVSAAASVNVDPAGAEDAARFAAVGH
ncbi:MAG: hypothetical protein EAZ30_03300 [Betaproteobacteria bacterium]|nr:MAG: hypothetical protein EAZ30_03300 [Betaproteobacteria bacterium]